LAFGNGGQGTGSPSGTVHEKVVIPFVTFSNGSIKRGGGPRKRGHNERGVRIHGKGFNLPGKQQRPMGKKKKTGKERKGKTLG